MNDKYIYALGFFDGVHMGHQWLLRKCIQLAEEHGCKAAAVTFSIHPDTFVLGKTPGLINTIEDRVRLLRSVGIDDVVVLPFDKKMQTMPWRDFLDFLREEYHAAGFVCGYDFRFGHMGAGDQEKLEAYCQEHNLCCDFIAKVKLATFRVSSTYIRTLLEEGAITSANVFLAHKHILTGKVVSGRQLGRTLGIPTANLHLPEELVKLPFGVYCCKAEVDGQTYLAVTNIGNRPTVGGHRVTVEPWLLDFEGDLYGKELTLSFYHFLRPEQKFPSLEALKEEILKNAAETRKFFEKYAK